MEPLTPIYTCDLFPALHGELITLLRGLNPDDWLRPTIAGSWRVRDVAAHLLDVDLRKIAGARDCHRPSAIEPVKSYADIVSLINHQNSTGVSYAQRLSTRLLTDLLEITGRWVSDLFADLEPHHRAHISVAWAGEEVSENWMDIGREYTERWHHQMHIRDAVGSDPLMEQRWFWPVLDLSVRAFPRAYDGVTADVGTAIVFAVEGEGENVWSLIREAAGWRVFRGRAPDAAAVVRVDGDTAWKLLYNALSPEAACARVRIEGDRSLAEPMLRTRSVMV